MAAITLKGNTINTIGTLPAVGTQAPAFSLVGKDLSEVSLSNYAGQKLVLNIVPSIDTGICAASARAFNEKATSFENTKVITISMDLPFAAGRFCAAEGIEDVVMASAFRAPAFGPAYGITLADSVMAGLFGRAIVVLDADHKVVYTELVPEIVQEPNYDAAIAALG